MQKSNEMVMVNLKPTASFIYGTNQSSNKLPLTRFDNIQLDSNEWPTGQEVHILFFWCFS